MAKNKKITVKDFREAVKKNDIGAVTESWRGLDVVISPFISLQDLIDITTIASKGCFLDDGEFVPEASEAILNAAIVEKYTNITLPKDISERYELVVKSGIMDLIFQHIDAAQYNQIVVAVRDKIDYMCDLKASDFNKAITDIGQAMTELRGKASAVLDGVTSDDIRTVLSVINSDISPEERAVSELVAK